MSSLESPAELIAKFTKAVSENQKAVAAVVAALTFCVYDIILSFPQEVKYIWRSKQSLVTMLYFFVRYYSVLNLIALATLYTRTSADLGYQVYMCKGYYIWSVAAVPCIHLLAVDTLLLLRIFALYDRSKLVLTILASLVFVDLSINQWANASLAKELIREVAVIPPPYLGCATLVPNLKYNLISYVLNFTLSLVFLAMTLKKLVENIQRLYGKLTWKSYKDVGMLSPLLVAFSHDGSIFFALTSATLLFEIIALFAVGGPVQVAITPWHLAMYSYSCSHLVLNLRARGDANQTWSETMSMPYNARDGDGIQSIRFA